MKMLNLPENSAFKDSHSRCKLRAFRASFIQHVSGKMTRPLGGRLGRARVRELTSLGGGWLGFIPAPVMLQEQAYVPGVKAMWVPTLTHVDCPWNVLFKLCS